MNLIVFSWLVSFAFYCIILIIVVFISYLLLNLFYEYSILFVLNALPVKHFVTFVWISAVFLKMYYY